MHSVASGDDVRFYKLQQVATRFSYQVIKDWGKGDLNLGYLTLEIGSTAHPIDHEIDNAAFIDNRQE
ncbi:MAG: hypothetical protein ACQEQO_02115 [Thermodesulfobacteriota bacterium]